MFNAILTGLNYLLDYVDYEENVKHFSDTPVSPESKTNEAWVEAFQDRPSTIKLSHRYVKVQSQSLFSLIELFYKAYCYKIAKSRFYPPTKEDSPLKEEKMSQLASAAMSEHRVFCDQMHNTIVEDLAPTTFFKSFARYCLGDAIELSDEIDSIKDSNDIEDFKGSFQYLLNHAKDVPNIKKLQEIGKKTSQFFRTKFKEFLEEKSAKRQNYIIATIHKMAMKNIYEILAPFSDDSLYENYEVDFKENLHMRLSNDCQINHRILIKYESIYGPISLEKFKAIELYFFSTVYNAPVNNYITCDKCEQMEQVTHKSPKTRTYVLLSDKCKYKELKKILTYSKKKGYRFSILSNDLARLKTV